MVNRTERAWRVIAAEAEGVVARDADAVESAYACGGHEFVEPRVIAGHAPIADGDQVFPAPTARAR